MIDICTSIDQYFTHLLVAQRGSVVKGIVLKQESRLLKPSIHIDTIDAKDSRTTPCYFPPSELGAEETLKRRNSN